MYDAVELERPPYPYAKLAAGNLRNNRLALEAKTGKHPEYTPPAPGHYWGLYLWDEVAHAIIQARDGSPDSLRAGWLGIKSLFKIQEADGFIPNSWEGAGPKRRIEPERWVGFKGNRSNYTQPPIFGLGLAELYDSTCASEGQASAEARLREVYGSAKLAYQYFDKYRRVAPDDRRIVIVHPHETGRDSDPTYNYKKPWRLPRKGVETPLLVDKANVVLDYAQSLMISRRLGQANGDITKARQAFQAVDIMMNCLLVDSLHQMSGLAKVLGKPEDAAYFSGFANDVEEKLYEHNWFPEAKAGRGMFYSTDAQGNPVIETSINNLFGLLLPNLKADQLESLLELADTSFNVNFPFPSVGTDSPNYDPYYRQKGRIWCGPGWQLPDFLIDERGLKKQLNREDLADRPDLLERCRQWDERVVKSMLGRLAIGGLSEFFNPDTGQGFRPQVKMFGWSNLGFVTKIF